MSSVLKIPSLTSEGFCVDDLWVLTNIGNDCPESKDNCTKTDFLNLSFIRAIQAGDVEKARFLIQLGVDIDDPEPNSWTPLHSAARFGRQYILELLIQNGATLNAVYIGPEKLGQTPLYQAAQMNYLTCAKTFLKYGSKLSLQTEDICPPLLMAVFRGHVEMVALLLDYGVNINLRFTNRFTNHFFGFFKFSLLPELWKDQNLPLLHCAILLESKRMMKFLLIRGVDINMKTSNGKTTLMQAVGANDVEMVKFLLKKGADVIARDFLGQPVLHFTVINANFKASMYSKKENLASRNKIRIVYLLVNAGADINARFPKNADHSSIIYFMVAHGFLPGVAYLLLCPDLDYRSIDLTTVYSGQLLNNQVTSDIENDVNYIQNLYNDFESITYGIMHWAIIRKMFRLPYNKDVLLVYPIHGWITAEEYTREIDDATEFLKKKLQDMRQMKINRSDVTFWDLLVCDMDDLEKQVTNSSIDYLATLIENKNKLERCFFFMLERQLKIDGKKRNIILDAATHSALQEFNPLPYKNYRTISDYLNCDKL